MEYFKLFQGAYNETGNVLKFHLFAIFDKYLILSFNVNRKIPVQGSHYIILALWYILLAVSRYFDLSKTISFQQRVG